MLTKTELEILWRKYDFRPSKRWGQNFLIDKNVKANILKSLELGTHDRVLEIGAGFGEITFSLAEMAGSVIAVEKDKKIVKILNSASNVPDNVKLYEGDFLDFDLSRVSAGGKLVVYGNIPYYVTSPILEKLFKNISFIKRIYLVVQEEVGLRILAVPGSKRMGRLSLYTQYHSNPRAVFKIGRRSFYPAPKVDSVFVRFDIPAVKKIKVKNETAMFGIIKKAYHNRRKTILNSVSGKDMEKNAVRETLVRSGIDPASRAEDLSLSDFARLSEEL
ncbi:MAG: ribosomal RNA small subunit methyltransferase A [Candidatus Omnitrophica bacterium]|nr:ribosomal RNA small subunit methyltransferase A [Candidatus Omnitrophota bacterium]